MQWFSVSENWGLSPFKKEMINSLISYLIVFIFGVCVGSFLNCVIYRLETKQSFLRGRSFCPKCKHKLGFLDLIPILSFIILKGKCRYCGKKISWQYPLVESFTGILFVLVLNYELGIRNQGIFDFQGSLNLLFLILNSCFLILIFVFDLKHYIIPDKIIYPAIVIAFLYLLFESLRFKIWGLSEIWDLGFGIFKGLRLPLLAAFSAGGFFFLLWFLSRGKWLGFGDVKLAFFMGLFLGWPNILVGLFSAVLIGATIGLVLVGLGKKTLKSQVPFGPFLVTGTFIALFLGQNLIKWYLNLL